MWLLIIHPNMSEVYFLIMNRVIKHLWQKFISWLKHSNYYEHVLETNAWNLYTICISALSMKFVACFLSAVSMIHRA